MLQNYINRNDMIISFLCSRLALRCLEKSKLQLTRSISPLPLSEEYVISVDFKNRERVQKDEILLTIMQYTSQKNKLIRYQAHLFNSPKYLQIQALSEESNEDVYDRIDFGDKQEDQSHMSQTVDDDGLMCSPPSTNESDSLVLEQSSSITLYSPPRAMQSELENSTPLGEVDLRKLNITKESIRTKPKPEKSAVFKTFILPRAKTGGIIGRNGHMINFIRQTTNTTIKIIDLFTANGNRVCEFNITGSPYNVDEAIAIISNKLMQNKKSYRPDASKQSLIQDFRM